MSLVGAIIALFYLWRNYFRKKFFPSFDLESEQSSTKKKEELEQEMEKVSISESSDSGSGTKNDDSTKENNTTPEIPSEIITENAYLDYLKGVQQ